MTRIYKRLHTIVCPQMVAACAGFERVFEIGPVFRAENRYCSTHGPPIAPISFAPVLTSPVALPPVPLQQHAPPLVRVYGVGLRNGH
jgi:hypothetical protein